MPIDPRDQVLLQQMFRRLKREIVEKVMEEIGWPQGVQASNIIRGGLVRGDRVSGSVSISHALWSSTHSDVDASDTPANGDVITWDAVAGKWIAAPPAGGGGGNWTLISHQVLGSAASSVSFSSIPGTYKHLALFVHARSTNASTSIGASIRFNGDSGNNYDRQILSGSGSSLFASAAFAGTSGLIGEIAAANAPTDASGGIMAWIYDYTATTFNKSVTSQYKAKRGTSGNGMIVGYASVEWRSTSAITDIDVLCDTGSFLTGSAFTLYGVS